MALTEAEKKAIEERTNDEASTNNTFPIIENNVGTLERVISLAAGSYFLYKAFKQKSLIKAGLGGYLMYRGASGYCPTAQLFGRSHKLKNHNINSRVSVIVNKPRHEVYEFWRKLENLPLFMQHLEEVKTLDDKTSAWKAAAPGKLPGLVWITEIVADEKNERIGWQSIEGSDVFTAGNVHFKDAGEFGTEINAVISYRPAYGKVGEMIAEALNPALEDLIAEDIKRLKDYMEIQDFVSPSPNTKTTKTTVVEKTVITPKTEI